MTALPNLASRLFGVPLMITPDAAATILSVLGDKLEIGAIVVDGTAVDLATARSRGRERAPREYSVTDDGVALVPVLGTLTSRSMSLRPASGMTGYDSVERAFEQAMSDPGVHGVLMQLDSPGSEAGGALEAARYVASLRGQKPIWAVADHQAASSAYALASAADRIVMPSGGEVGSVGVLAGFTHQTHLLLIPGGNRLSLLEHRPEEPRLHRRWLLQRWPVYRTTIPYA
jgi:ClpP class serine protease